MADYAAPAEEEAKPGKPRGAKPYLDMILEAEKAFKVYQDKCDNIDKLYADLDKLANLSRDRQFQMFWANIQVVNPSTYSRPPVPVAVPRFKSQKPLPREASILIERVAITNFDQEHIDDLMRLVRDDVNISARGVAWVSYAAAGEDKTFWERCRLEHVDRKDFLHDPARKWAEVEWVARGAWINRKKSKERFGPQAKLLKFETRKATDDQSDQTIEKKARVWEIWHKTEKKICWVSPGVDELLDEKTPKDMVDVTDFFPCPKPAFGTLQQRSLKPIPDFLQYKDQVEEINELTARISALSEALRLKGFYAAGGEDIGDAIETAIKATDNNALLIPVANFAAMGGAKLADSIIWLPVDMVAKTISELVQLRKQLIEDVYQITGLSDIMRGATDANETLGAQQLKSQYGSIRIKDRQAELVRFARDLTRIMCEIMAEEFQTETLVAMSQSELPTAEDIQKQAAQVQQQAQGIQQQLQQAQSDPQIMQQAQANPDQAKQMMEQAQQQLQGFEKQLQTLQNTVTIDAVVGLLRAEKLRPFILDIETDSTIQPDEDAAKQRMSEYVTAVGGFVSQSFPMVQQEPKLAPFVGAMLKQVSGVFRAGREMEGVIEELVDQMKQLASQPKPPSPEAQKAEAEQAKAQMDAQTAQAKAQSDQANAQATAAAAQAKAQADVAKINADVEAKRVETGLRQAEITAKSQADAQTHQQEMQKGELELEKLRLEIARIGVQTRADVVKTQAGVEATQQKTEIAASKAKQSESA